MPFALTNARFDPQISPILRLQRAVDPWPNIQLEFIEWRDETHSLVTTFAQHRIRCNNSPGTMYAHENAANSLDPDLTPPIQWAGNIGRSGGDDCSMRWVADLGPDSLTAEPGSPFNTWIRIAFSPTFKLVNGDVGTTKNNISVFQIARTSDLTTIIGQAQKTIFLTRIP